SLIVLLLTAALIALALWRMEKNKTPEKSDQLPALVFKAGELTQPGMYDIGRRIEISGTVHAPDSLTIKAKASGQLKSLSVIEGQLVQQGQSIGTLDLTELQSRLAERRAALAAAKTALTQASTQWEANQRLAERGFLAATAIETSRASLESARAQVQAAESALQTVQVQLRDADLVAPIRGWIQKRLALEGEKLAIEQGIVSILSTDRLEILTPIGAPDAQPLQVGRPQSFRIDGVNEPVQATLSRIMLSADPNARALTLVWAIAGSPSLRLRPGQFAIASIELANPHPRLTLPVDAIRQEGGKSVAWVIHEGKLQRKALITGKRSSDGNRIEILEGLSESDQVLAMRFEGLREGQMASVSHDARPKQPGAAPAKRESPSS
ncbi:MAG: efflux RND transporter periplasmic adaptor subunit, partial [Betaproteobacteria bacterium]|nr:efflux RND transporter periplasmic adaptor subunit [Betaproteobacteria bacterium]